MLDDIITGAKPEDEISTLVTSIDVSLLRDLKEKLDKEPIENALEFVKNHSHLRLWQELAKSGLKQLNLEIANNAFVRCQDYQGIQFLKRLRKLEVNRILTKDPQKKKAEVLAYCCEFDEAEKLYLSMDRKDLAIDLRARLGDSFKVVQLIKSGGGADDATLAKAWNEIGDYYFDRKQLPQAISYYQQAGNVEKLIECYFSLDDYSNAEKLASNLTENSKQLNRFAEKFLAAGFCQPACNAYFKLGNISGAIQACVTLNQWDMAISLAEKHQFLEIEGYLLSYAKHILGKNRKKEAVELFRRANYCLHSAKLIFEMANEAVLKDHSPATVKKLFVLGALEVERHFVLQRNSKSNGHVALDKLLEQNNNSECFSLQNPWRGAEAYHFYLLAQRQFYTGHLVAAVTTVIIFITIDSASNQI